LRRGFPAQSNEKDDSLRISKKGLKFAQKKMRKMRKMKKTKKTKKRKKRKKQKKNFGKETIIPKLRSTVGILSLLTTHVFSGCLPLSRYDPPSSPAVSSMYSIFSRGNFPSPDRMLLH
jgi:hypothetical protein